MMESPIVLLDPIRKISEYGYSYNLRDLKRNPKGKSFYKKQFKEKYDMTTS